MKLSLIITTYNWEDALEVALLSAFEQTRLPDEIIVADDGSKKETRELVEAMKNDAPVPIHHSWQEDKGFRLARSRNRAMVKAQGEYIILIDGDVVLEKHFIEDHLKFRRPGYFIQGTRVLLNSSLSERVLSRKRMERGFCYKGVENRKNCLRSNLLSQLFSFSSSSLVGVKTCNFAFNKSDAVAVNGFNEEFVGWGREDSEFIVRLLNNGVRRQNMKFNGLVYHLYHPMNDRARLQQNDVILQETIDQKLTWCENGISQHEKSTSEGR